MNKIPQENLTQYKDTLVANFSKRRRRRNIETEIARYRIVNRLSHGEIAKLLGVTRQAISRRLKHMDVNAIFEAYRRKR